jgi:hypothetical protein
MIRVLILPRLRKTAGRLPADVRLKAQTALVAVAAAFGNPHAHSGLGLRKLARRSYEIRVHLHWRIVFIHDGDTLVAYDLMTHDEVARWLRGQRK